MEGEGEGSGDAIGSANSRTICEPVRDSKVLWRLRAARCGRATVELWPVLVQGVSTLGGSWAFSCVRLDGAQGRHGAGTRGEEVIDVPLACRAVLGWDDGSGDGSARFGVGIGVTFELAGAEELCKLFGFPLPLGGRSPATGAGLMEMGERRDAEPPHERVVSRDSEGTLEPEECGGTKGMCEGRTAVTLPEDDRSRAPTPAFGLWPVARTSSGPLLGVLSSRLYLTSRSVTMTSFPNSSCRCLSLSS